MGDRPALAGALAPGRSQPLAQLRDEEGGGEVRPQGQGPARPAGELHLLDEEPRGTVTLQRLHLRGVVAGVRRAQPHRRGTRDNYARSSTCGSSRAGATHPLRTLEPGPDRGVGVQAAQGRRRRRRRSSRRSPSSASILKRAERDEEIDRNPIPLVAKPKQQPKRAPRPIAPYLVERIRAAHARPAAAPRHARAARPGTRSGATRDGRDAGLAAGLFGPAAGVRGAAPGVSSRSAAARSRSGRPRAASWSNARRGCSSRSRRDLRRWRACAARAERRRPRLPLSAVKWRGDDWDNWRERIFQPAAIAVGLPRDTLPRDLRGSFASLLIYEGVDVVEVAPELGHSADHLPGLLRARVRGVRGPPAAPGGRGDPRGPHGRAGRRCTHSVPGGDEGGAGAVCVNRQEDGR